MKHFRFNAAGDLIRVVATVWGRERSSRIKLAIDTGSTETLLMPHVIEELGYGEIDALRRTVIRGPFGDEPGYMLLIARFTTLGFGPVRPAPQELSNDQR